MKTLAYYKCRAAYIGVGFALASAAWAQVRSIDSVLIMPRVYNDIPGATGAFVNRFPGFISFTEAGVSQTSGGFADRDVGYFSNDGGASPYPFRNNDYFSASFSVTVSATADSPRKEAGFLLSDVNHTFPGGDLQFIVDSDGHEVVQFGGFSFYAFAPDYVSPYFTGTTIRLGIKYFRTRDGNNAFQFSASGISSPVFELPPGVGIGDGSPLGGYFQIVNDPNNPGNAGTAVFRGIQIVSIGGDDQGDDAQ